MCVDRSQESPNMSQTRRLTVAPATDTNGCCSTAPLTSLAAATPAAASSTSACCGDPTPDAATGACCSDPADSCSCQTTAERTERTERVDVVSRRRDADAAAAGRLPVAVIGAGPIGLAAAAHLLEKGETPIVFGLGDAVRASRPEWRHVGRCWPWRYLAK